MPLPPGRWRFRAAVYAAATAALWPFPLLGLLHVEAAAVTAAVAYVTAGLGGLAAFRRGDGLGRVLRRELALLAVPLAGLTLTLLWRPNCGYAQGLLFFAVFPGVTVMLAVSTAYALAASGVRRPRAALVGLGALVAAAGPLYDLGLHPQFYTYNHVWGGVLGPIYDEELAVRPGLFAFRGLTLLWAGVALAVGARRHRSLDVRRRARRALPILALAVGAVYAASGPLGINTPAWYLQQTLGGTFRTAHFDLYYDPASLDDAALRRLADVHEYRYARLADALGVRPDERVASYLYPDPGTKARLTGARTTNVAPVWLARPQSHVLLPVFDEVFAHELAHVFSRPFGLPVLNASLSVGLVEGLAVALEPPDGRPTPHEQVIAAALRRAGPGGAPDLADAVAGALSPVGFWTGRGAVSYTTMGSFVRYLLDAYGAAPLRAAYPWGDFEGAYGRSVEALAAEWEAYLLRPAAVDRATGGLAARRFSVPSLFEVRCPHHVPAFVRRHRAGAAALEAGDAQAARDDFAAALAAAPDYDAALVGWARASLALGAADTVAARLAAVEAGRRTPALSAALGDAHALRGAPAAARAAYADAARDLPPYARASRTHAVLRYAAAARPDAVRALAAAGPAAARAVAFEDVPDRVRADETAERGAAVRVMRATRLADAGDYAAAYETLAATPLPAAALPADLPLGLRADAERQRLVWLAEWAERAGLPARAAGHAADAERASRAVGARNAADALADLRARLAWTVRHRAPGPTATDEITP